MLSWTEVYSLVLYCRIVWYGIRANRTSNMSTRRGQYHIVYGEHNGLLLNVASVGNDPYYIYTPIQNNYK